jgi:glycosyltransferase involved in cell wall biosynthesis
MLTSNTIKKEKIDISIVVPAYNEEFYLPICLDSIMEQKTRLNYEVIVVNNNSKDKTYQVAKSYGVRVFNEKRKGVGQARLTGTEKARGEIVLHVDADTQLPEDHLEKVWKEFQSDPALACLGGRYSYYDAPFWKDYIIRAMFKPVCYTAKIISKGKLGTPGGNMAFRKNAYEETCGFDPSLNFGEDWALSYELKKLGDVKINMNLGCKVSCRRYKINKKLFIYMINFMSLCFRSKPLRNELPHYEEL